MWEAGINPDVFHFKTYTLRPHSAHLQIFIQCFLAVHLAHTRPQLSSGTYPALNFPLPKATGKMALQAAETCRHSLQVRYVRNNSKILSRYTNIRRKKMLRTILMENGKVTLKPWLTWKWRLNYTKCFYLIFIQMPIGCCSEPKPEKHGFQELQWEFKIKK